MDAFILDIGVLLFFLPYTYGVSAAWVYDVLRDKFLRNMPPRGLDALPGDPVAPVGQQREMSSANVVR